MSDAVAEMRLRRYTSYRKERKLVYVEDSATSTHWVPECNWDLYMAHRRQTPRLVVLCDRVKELQEKLAREGVVV